MTYVKYLPFGRGFKHFSKKSMTLFHGAVYLAKLIKLIYYRHHIRKSSQYSLSFVYFSNFQVMRFKDNMWVLFSSPKQQKVPKFAYRNGAKRACNVYRDQNEEKQYRWLRLLGTPVSYAHYIWFLSQEIDVK